MQIWNPAPANAKSPFEPCPPHKVLCNSVFWEPSGESPGCPIQAFLWLEWGTGAKFLHDLVFWKTTRHGRAGLQVSSSMTSFTKRSGTSFTLRPAGVAGGGQENSPRQRARDGLENEGRGRASHEICGGGESAGKEFDRTVCRVRDLAAYRLRLAEAISGGWDRGDARGEPASASQSGENAGRGGATGGGVAAAAAGLGSAQDPASVGEGRHRAAGEYDSSHLSAAAVGAGLGSSADGAAALRAGATEPTLADGLQRSQGMGSGGGSAVGAGRSQPLCAGSGKHGQHAGARCTGRAGAGFPRQRSAGRNADGSRQALVQHARSHGLESIYGVADGSGCELALQRLPASADSGQGGTVSSQSDRGPVAPGHARGQRTAKLAERLSPGIQLCASA